MLSNEQLLARRCQHRLRRLRLPALRWLLSAKDAGLLAPNGFAIRPQVIDMIDANACKDRAIRIDDVHRIEPPAQADLEHRHLYLFAREQPQRAERAVLEIRQWRIATC